MENENSYYWCWYAVPSSWGDTSVVIETDNGMSHVSQHWEGGGGGGLGQNEAQLTVKGNIKKQRKSD